MNVNFDFDKLRQSIAVHYDELARVMNSHQEAMLNGESRIEIETAQAQQLMHNLRADLQKLMFLENEKSGISSFGVKLNRVHVYPAKRFELCRA